MAVFFPGTALGCAKDKGLWFGALDFQRVCLLQTKCQHVETKLVKEKIPNLVMTNSSPWKITHRNRWFTYINSMVIFHGYVSHNQMVLTTSAQRFVAMGPRPWPWLASFVAMGTFQ